MDIQPLDEAIVDLQVGARQSIIINTGLFPM